MDLLHVREAVAGWRAVIPLVPAHQRSRDARPLEADRRRRLGGLHLLAFARPLPRVESGKNRGVEVHRANLVAEGPLDQHRRVARPAAHRVHGTGERLRDRVEGGPRAPVADGPKPAVLAVDEPRVPRAADLVAEAEPVERADLEVLAEHLLTAWQ